MTMPQIDGCQLLPSCALQHTEVSQGGHRVLRHPQNRLVAPGCRRLVLGDPVSDGANYDVYRQICIPGPVPGIERINDEISQRPVVLSRKEVEQWVDPLVRRAALRQCHQRRAHVGVVEVALTEYEEDILDAPARCLAEDILTTRTVEIEKLSAPAA